MKKIEEPINTITNKPYEGESHFRRFQPGEGNGSGSGSSYAMTHMGEGYGASGTHINSKNGRYSIGQGEAYD